MKKQIKLANYRVCCSRSFPRRRSRVLVDKSYADNARAAFSI